MIKSSSPRRVAFTLIELLVVMGIIVLMGALVVPAVSGSLKGTALNQAAQTMQAQFNAAQQNALAKGQTIELRLIMCADPDSPSADKDEDSPGGATGNPNAGWKLRAMQLYTVTSNPDLSTVATIKQRFTPFTKLDFLPTTVIIDSGSVLSSICDSTLLVDKIAQGTEDYLHPKLPRIGSNYKYYHIQFRADGTTTLDANKTWFLTMHDLNKGDNLSVPPSNFFTLSLDAVQGSTRAFRPM